MRWEWSHSWEVTQHLTPVRTKTSDVPAFFPTRETNSKPLIRSVPDVGHVCHIFTRPQIPSAPHFLLNHVWHGAPKLWPFKISLRRFVNKWSLGWTSSFWVKPSKGVSGIRIRRPSTHIHWRSLSFLH